MNARGLMELILFSISNANNYQEKNHDSIEKDFDNSGLQISVTHADCANSAMVS